MQLQQKTLQQGYCRCINMIAGGTGVTPMLQVLRAVLRDADDPTQTALIFANQSPADIFLRDEIDALARDHPRRFRVWYSRDSQLGDED